MVLDLHIHWLKIVDQTETCHIGLLLAMWKEALVEIIGCLIVLLIAQMLGKCYLEDQGHEVLHILNPEIKLFLREGVVHHL